MQIKARSLVLATGLFIALGSGGSALAESPRGGGYAKHHKPVRVTHVQHQRPAYKVNRGQSRINGYAWNHGRLRPARSYRSRLNRGHGRYRAGFRSYRGRYRHHGHHRRVDAGAVIAGLVLGQLVYELLDANREDEVHYAGTYYDN